MFCSPTIAQLSIPFVFSLTDHFSTAGSSSTARPQVPTANFTLNGRFLNRKSSFFRGSSPFNVQLAALWSIYIS